MNEINLRLPNGRIVKASEEGTCEINTLDKEGKNVKLTVTQVLFSPEILNNLLSITKLIRKRYKVKHTGKYLPRC